MNAYNVKMYSTPVLCIRSVEWFEEALGLLNVDFDSALYLFNVIQSAIAELLSREPRTHSELRLISLAVKGVRQLTNLFLKQMDGDAQ